MMKQLVLVSCILDLYFLQRSLKILPLSAFGGSKKHQKSIKNSSQNSNQLCPILRLKTRRVQITYKT
jgi:hypothetical protein